MNIVLWIVAVLLALVFAAAGTMKLARSKAQLAEAGQAWVESFPPGAVKAIGALELLAAIGLIVPALTGVAPSLVGWAAVGLALLMAGAVVTHARRREYPLIAVNLVLLALAVFVAWGRLGSYPVG